MNTETPTPPTIAELWREFQRLSEAYNPDFGEDQQLAINYHALRSQLLERCKRPPRTAMVGSPEFFINSHKEHSAYHAFCAWELEQREKDAKP